MGLKPALNQRLVASEMETIKRRHCNMSGLFLRHCIVIVTPVIVSDVLYLQRVRTGARSVNWTTLGLAASVSWITVRRDTRRTRNATVSVNTVSYIHSPNVRALMIYLRTVRRYSCQFEVAAGNFGHVYLQLVRLTATHVTWREKTRGACLTAVRMDPVRTQIRHVKVGLSSTCGCCSLRAHRDDASDTVLLLRARLHQASAVNARWRYWYNSHWKQWKQLESL